MLRICPSIHVVGTTEELDLNRRYVSSDVLVLLEAERDCRSKKPDHLICLVLGHAYGMDSVPGAKGDGRAHVTFSSQPYREHCS